MRYGLYGTVQQQPPFNRSNYNLTPDSPFSDNGANDRGPANFNENQRFRNHNYDNNLYNERDLYNNNMNMLNRSRLFDDNPDFNSFYGRNDRFYNQNDRQSNFDRNQDRFNLNQRFMDRQNFQQERVYQIEMEKLRNLLLEIDQKSSQECTTNVAAQWNFETNVNGYTQAEAVSSSQL